MKLSEAIRLGSMSTHQIYGMLVAGSGQRTCALGAAYFAVGILEEVLSCKVDPFNKFPILKKIVNHPLNKNCKLQLFTVIMNLNDVCCWTREEIADWVETIEKEIESNDVTESTSHTLQPVTVTI